MVVQFQNTQVDSLKQNGCSGLENANLHPKKGNSNRLPRIPEARYVLGLGPFSCQPYMKSPQKQWDPVGIVVVYLVLYIVKML